MRAGEYGDPTSFQGRDARIPIGNGHIIDSEDLPGSHRLSLSHQVMLLWTRRYQIIVTVSSVSLVLVQQPVGLCGPRVHEGTHLADSNNVQMPFEGINRTGIHCVMCESVPTV